MKRTHCRQGHDLVGDNVRISPGSGARSCQTCNRKRAADRYEREHPGHRKAGPWSHCKNGHEMVGDNVYIAPSSTGRTCRICKATNQSEYNKTHGKLNRERHAEKIAARMDNWRKRNREHEAEYRKAYRPRALELRRAKYAEDYAKPQRRALSEADRERNNALKRECQQRDREAIKARRVKRDLQIKQAIGTARTGRFTAAEDAIALRDDLTVIEKAFMLQRMPASVTARKTYLSNTCKARLKRQRRQIAEYQLKYRESNRDRLDAQQQAYRQQNAEVLRKKGQERYYANRADRIAAVRRYALLNPEKTRETQRRYRERQRANRQQAAK